MKWLCCFLLSVALLPAQKTLPGQEKPASEDDLLGRAMGEAGSSPLEQIRALERHLARFPKSARRDEIERALTKAAIEARDNTRLLKYGEPYIKQNPGDLLVLERLCRVLTTREDADSNKRGLEYARAFEKGLLQVSKQDPEDGRMTAQLRDDIDRGLGRAYTFQARALGHLGQLDEAVELARKSFSIYPSSEPARDIANLLIKQNKVNDALPHLADAFALPDPRVTDEDRRAVRKQMGEVYSKLHGSEKGMGDLLLAAFDRAAAIDTQRRAYLRQIDPNSEATSAMDYTITGVNGEKLDLKSLRGKVVVLDFWATWCGPCRIQYPMYEQVKQQFKARNDVVFLGINTDANREAVKPFLQEQKWNKAVYYEDGLSQLLKVGSIPSTFIFNRKGELATRMNGFVPDRFIEMLTERIKEALAE
ncbi:MAG: TlpA family protein disulfide reductase [Bryobacterales bacterium]|nr:TlpA family protein disulfide reductase [Bryobacterales bacterium]